MLLRDKNVIVFGGTSGLGLATAQLASKEGANVTVVGSSEIKVASARRQLGDGIQAFKLDVREESEVAALTARFDRIDHVISTIGVLASSDKPGGAALSDPFAELLRPMTVRFNGSLLIARHCLPLMRAEGSINFTTGGGMFRPSPGEAVTIASEGAVELLARSLAVEFAPIRFNCVSPGAIDTGLTRSLFGEGYETVAASLGKTIPAGRLGTADEIAHGFMFLMTNHYVTGISLVIDGGYRFV